ncbi:MAG TPA: four helix bundle protein [Bacteroidales bacterium]|nr:four helix bundle protein [Bacteroidales bacterium]HOH22355.1 four helix bundle protein [Bacteroidales bacterium]HPB58309.1 four helix bundle protein [Bacteroidales bacterium]HPZ03018.1 four helix bundle protein [Bacteroidales bacterium]HQB75049.1 four helix bundle protein [Bacteroidales bacterium]
MSKELQDRTKCFSLSIIDLVEQIDYSISKRVVMQQLVRSATSVGANYRAVCRARSSKEFIAKLNIVLEEIDECCFWLEIIQSKKWYDVEELLDEANQLTAMFVSALKTIKRKLNYESQNQHLEPQDPKS